MNRSDRWLSPNVADMLRVCLVADPEQTERDLEEDVLAALEGGVTCVQLRAKRLSDRDAWHLAMRLRELCRSYHAMFIVNDRLDVALAAQTDGVHLGATDLPVWMARWVVGRDTDFVIGYSPTSRYDVSQARGADYIGVGPVYPTASKADAGEPLGLDGLAEIVESAEEMPVVAIGGITADNAPAVIAAGAAGVAVIGAILRAPDPQDATTRLVQAVMNARG